MSCTEILEMNIRTMLPPTAPLVARSPMRARPWFGLLRGSLLALLPGLQFFWNPQDPPAWLLVAQRRRRVLLLAIALLAGTALALVMLSAPADAGLAWMIYAALAVLMLGWVGAGLATALMGAWVLLRGDRHALQLANEHAPIDAGARTAIIMPICNEDISTVFAGLRATCESLAATGALQAVRLLHPLRQLRPRSAHGRAAGLGASAHDARRPRSATMADASSTACGGGAQNARPATSPTSAAAGAATIATWWCSTPTARCRATRWSRWCG